MPKSISRFCVAFPVVSPDTSVADARTRIGQRGIIVLGRDGIVQGIVQARELFLASTSLTLSEVASPQIHWVPANAGVGAVLDALEDVGSDTVLVGAPDDYRGCITSRSLLMGLRTDRVRGMAPEIPLGAQRLPSTRSAILVVEDDPTVRALQCRVVEELGYEPIAAGSMDEARNVITSTASRLGLVMLDMHLPDGLGTDLCAELVDGRWHDALAVPVMMVSAETNTEIIADAFFAGSVRHIQKPFQPLDLLQAIEEVIDAEL